MINQLPTKEELLSRIEELEKRIENIVLVKKKEIESLGFRMTKDYSTEYYFQTIRKNQGDYEYFYELELDKETLLMQLDLYICKGKTMLCDCITILVGHLTIHNIQNELKRLENETIQ